jgi:hypothetical protein
MLSENLEWYYIIIWTRSYEIDRIHAKQFTYYRCEFLCHYFKVKFSQHWKNPHAMKTYLDERFETFTTVKIQVEVFWVVTPCNLMEYQCFRGPCCLHLHWAWTSETLVFYSTIRRHNPKDFDLNMETEWTSKTLVSYHRTTRRFPWGKAAGLEADHSIPSSAEVKEWVELHLHSPIRFHGVVFS